MGYSPRGATALATLIDYVRRTDGARVAALARVDEALASTERVWMSDLHTGGWTSGLDDSGFRTEFRDPWPRSINQVGHFLTAVNHGMHGVGWIGVLVTYGSAGAGNVTDAMQLDLGHEFVADPEILPLDGQRPWAVPYAFSTVSGNTGRIRGRVYLSPGGFMLQHAAAGSQDMVDFRAALAQMNPATNGVVDLARLRADLGPIIARHRVPTTQVPGRDGNSVQDLMLTAMGWHFGAMVQAGAFRTAGEAADWLERNL